MTSNAQRSWFERFVALGNDHKVIAAATLVTLATGVPYLVVTAVRAVAGGEREIPAEMLDALWQSARARVDAVGAERGSEARTVAGAQGTIDVLAAEARRAGATAKERREVTDAIRDYGAGREGRALAVLADIAARQEARGDLDAAAETLCSRGYLQILGDPRGALRDFEVAHEVSASGLDAYAQRERGRLLRIAMRFDDAVRAYRKAREVARAADDAEAEVHALTELGWIFGTSWDDDPAFQEEQHRANLRVVELAPAVLAADPGNLDVSVMLAKNGLMAGAGTGLMHDLPLVANERSPEVAGVLAAELERVRALDAGAMPELDRKSLLALLNTSLAVVRTALGEREAAQAGYLRTLELGREVLDDPRFSRRQMVILEPALTSAADHFAAQGDALHAEQAWAANARLMRGSIAFGDNAKSPLFQVGLAISLAEQGKATLALGRTEDGIALLREAVDVVRRAAGLFAEAAQATRQQEAMLRRCAATVAAADPALAEEWQRAADALSAG